MSIGTVWGSVVMVELFSIHLTEKFGTRDLAGLDIKEEPARSMVRKSSFR